MVPGLCPYHGNDWHPKECGVCAYCLIEMARRRQEGKDKPR